MIVITGASHGLGKEVAKLYQQAGKQVVNISRSECEYADVNLLHDLSKGSEIDLAAKALKDLQNPIVALINCVGVFTDESLGSISEDEIKRVMATNVKSNVLLLSSLLEQIKRDGTDILNVVSMTGTKATNEPVYGASKWAQRGFTLGLQLELKDTACRVVSFCPGGIQTDLFNKSGTSVDTSTFMKADEVAKIIKFCLDTPRGLEISEIFINRKVSQ